LGTRSSAEDASRVKAPKAPRGVGCGERVSPSPQGKGSSEEQYTLPRKIWGRGILGVKMAYFRGLLVLNFVFLSMTKKYRAVFFNLFVAAEPYTSVKITHGTPRSDP